MAPKSVPFAALVRAAMKRYLPDYKFESTAGGSGPVVTYRAPSTNRRVAASVFLQKGLYSPWIRANIATSFVDKRGGEHHIAQTALPDFTYTDAASLETHLASLLPRVDKARLKESAKVSKLAPALGGMLDAPQNHVTAWMKAEGTKLPPEDFDPDNFAFEAFEVFKQWLRSKKRFIPAGNLGLWHWWTDHHPKPRGPIKYAKPTKVTLRHPKTGAGIVITIKKHELDYTTFRRGQSAADGTGGVSYHPSPKRAITAGAEAVRDAKKQGYVEVDT